MDTLVHCLVRGVPLPDCVLMIFDPQRSAFVVYREDTTIGEGAGIASIRVDSPIVQWLNQKGRGVVKEEAKLNPEIAGYFETGEKEVDAVKAALVGPPENQGKVARNPPCGGEALGRYLRRPGARGARGARQPGRHLAGERAPLRRAVELERPAHAGEPAEVAILGEHVARAQDAAQLDHRVLESAPQPPGR